MELWKGMPTVTDVAPHQMSYHFTMCGSPDPSGAYRHRLQWLLADSYSVPRFQNKLRIKGSINTWCGVKDTHEGLLSHMRQWSAVRWCINTDSPLSPWWDQKMLISKKAYLWYFFLFWTVLRLQCLSRSEPSGGGSASVGIALFLRLSWRRVGPAVGSLSVLADSVFPGAASWSSDKGILSGPCQCTQAAASADL